MKKIISISLIDQKNNLTPECIVTGIRQPLTEVDISEFIAALKEPQKKRFFELSSYANSRVHLLLVNHKFKYRKGKTGKLITRPGYLYPSRWGVNGELPIGYFSKIDKKFHPMGISFGFRIEGKKFDGSIIDDPFVTTKEKPTNQR